MNVVEEGVAKVREVQASLDALEAQWFDLVELLVASIRDENIDAMVSAMEPKMKALFLSSAFRRWGQYPPILEECARTGEDPRGWLAMEAWSFRQPIPLDAAGAAAEYPGRPELDKLGQPEALFRLLPFLPRMTVEEMLDTMHPSWRRERLLHVTRGMRRGIDVILATARAHGQDERPLQMLMEWESCQPR